MRGQFNAVGEGAFTKLRRTPGHPECHYPGIEVCTGPLGQGISNAVGIAIAEAHTAATFNKPVRFTRARDSM